MSDKLTQERLKELMHYNHETGNFTWLDSTNRSIKAGSIAGCLHKLGGYIHIGLDHKFYQAHRLAFIYMTGSFPDQDTDHINGIKNDNRWVNLRAVSHTENGRNRKRTSTNTSGCTGVSWHKATGKWAVQISREGKGRHLGVFAELTEAIQARRQAEIKHGYHANHDRVA